MYYYELEFCYEDGSHFSVEECVWNQKDFVQLIRRYDDTVKIYIHQKMKKIDPLFCPFQRFGAEEPFVRKEVLEELSTLCNGNSFWRLSVKSRNKWNGNKEVELTLYGTTRAWLVWMVWLCLSVYIFFHACIHSEWAGLLALSLAGLCYYLIFFRSAGKITKKAIAIFNEAIFIRK